MTTKLVTMRLVAATNAYVAGMQGAARATDALIAKTSALGRVGVSLKNVGANMTRFVSTPLLLAGGAAVAMAANFEQAMARIVGLTNVTGRDIDGLRDSIMELAGETGRSPLELADALYTAASAGFDASEAMDVVEVAARGAMVGLGTTRDVANVLVTALNSYSDAGLTAAHATDVLTAAVREGRAEPEELAATLGRVLPVADAMGVSFEEATGMASFLTNVLDGADEAVTALRGTFLALLDPTKQGERTLEAMGTSVEELQQRIAEDGLLGGLQLLAEHGFADNSRALSDLVEDNRALNGIMLLLKGTMTGELQPVLEATANATGSLGDAISAVSDTDALKLQKALAQVQAAAITIGTVILPIVADIAQSIAGAMEAFAQLPEPVQGAILSFAGLLAVTGPLLMVAGSLVTSWTRVFSVFGSHAGTASRAAGTLGLVGVAALAAYHAFNFLTRSEELAAPHIDTASTALANETLAAYNAAVAAGAATTEVDALAVAHLALSNAISAAADDELNTALATLNITSEETLDVLTALGSGSLPTIQDEMARLTASYFGVDDATARYMLTLKGQGASLEFIAALLHTDVAAVEAWNSALDTTTRFADRNKDEINELALAYLNAQARLPGLASEALAAAEEIAGNRNEAGNAVPVYEEYIRQLVLLDPALAQAALSSGDLGVALSDLPPELQALIGPALEATDAISLIDPALRDLREATSPIPGGTGPFFKDYATELLEFEAALEKVDGRLTKVAGHVGPVKAVGEALGAFASDWKNAADLGPALVATLEAEAQALADIEAALDGVDAEYEDAQRNIGFFSDALERALGGNREWLRSHIANADALADFADNIEDASAGVDTNTEAGRDNALAVLDMADAVIAMTESNINAGMSQEAVNAEYLLGRDALIEAAVAAGLNEDQVNDLITAYGLTPELVTTTIKLFGQAVAEFQIRQWIDKLERIDPEIATQIIALVNEGKLAEAEALLNSIPDETVWIKPQLTLSTLNLGIRVNPIKSGGFPGRALGGYIDTPEVAEWGHGPEVMFPLSNPPRIRELWSDSRVYQPMMSALAATGAPSPAAPGEEIHHHYHVAVHNNGRPLTSSDIARGIREARSKV